MIFPSFTVVKLVVPYLITDCNKMIIFANLIKHYPHTSSYPKGICKWDELYLQLLKHTCFFSMGSGFIE